jgi:cytochrome c-type biogenesis protein
VSPDNLNIPIAFLAGLLSFASPCVMPLVPAYLGYLSGRAVGDPASEGHRLDTFWHALAFVLGFSLVFIALGGLVGLLGNLLLDSKIVLQKVGGVIIVLFGVHTLGLIQVPFLYQERRLEVRKKSELGYLSSLLMGIFFSAGWVPCVGPILAGILGLAYSTQTTGQAVLLLVFYSLGLGVPFLAAGLAFGAISGWLRRVNRYLKVVSIVSGALLVILGVLMVTDKLTYFARFGGFIGSL